MYGYRSPGPLVYEVRNQGAFSPRHFNVHMKLNVLGH
jgi:hypothetical protein